MHVPSDDHSANVWTQMVRGVYIKYVRDIQNRFDLVSMILSMYMYRVSVHRLQALDVQAQELEHREWEVCYDIM